LWWCRDGDGDGDGDDAGDGDGDNDGDGDGNGDGDGDGDCRGSDDNANDNNDARNSCYTVATQLLHCCHTQTHTMACGAESGALPVACG
jgi:hypothetical protein